MTIALSIFPCFSDKTLPLGLACIKTVLDDEGAATEVFDFDLLLSIEDPALYYQLHRLGADPGTALDDRMINFIGYRPDLTLTALFSPPEEARKRFEADGLEELFDQLNAFLEHAAARLLATELEQIWLSTYISNLWVSMLAARKLRERSKAIIVFGGPAVFPEEVQRFLLGNNLADRVVVGEGELTARELIRADGRPVAGAAQMVDGEFRYEPHREWLKPEKFPMPDFRGFPFADMPFDAYLNRRFEGLPVSFSRGCVNGCIYCSEKQIWKRFRHLSPETSVERLGAYKKRFGISLFYVCDSLINFSEAWLSEFCDLVVSSDLQPLFTFAFCDLKHLRPELTAKMAAAGFTRITFGLESASEAVLTKMHKKLDLDLARENIVEASRNGLSVHVSTIINFPGEQTGDALDTIRFFRQIDRKLADDNLPATHLPRRSLSNRFRLEPASAIFMHPERYGIRMEPLEAPWTQLGRETVRLAKKWCSSDSPEQLEWNAYLLSGFSKNPRPWHLSDEQYQRQAAAISSLIDPLKHQFTLSPHVVLNRPASENRLVLHDYREEFQLDDRQSQVIRLLAKGETLQEIAGKTTDRADQESAGSVSNFVLFLYVRGIARITGK
ncbi:B12-binding domain-containing radical SAM protein [Chlorobaculum sp. MV4-Y]|uniref:B12-binding domain-containing radical SAM protein n=1 Tax=Chlorobaculum sp. MV4-Y TaxID=2976335 RepID=UPI0021AFC10C|nr:radical SAM protein [Chlorobaculum sp. MV4-Y]UWX57821.1 B12-binding domain-containing radical SAM protein [Chlorobaculum sp. MV4-Y]